MSYSNHKTSIKLPNQSDNNYCFIVLISKSSSTSFILTYLTTLDDFSA